MLSVVNSLKSRVLNILAIGSALGHDSQTQGRALILLLPLQHAFNHSQVPPTMVLPVGVLQKALNKKLNVLLKDGRILEGKLTGFDDHLNLVLEDAVESVEGEGQRRLGTLILRGNNVITIAQQ